VRGRRWWLSTLSALALAGCAPAATGSREGRTEEAVATRAPAAAPAPADAGPLGDARAVHGTSDPATGRRTEEPAIDHQAREPRRSDLQAGRIRQAAEAYQEGGELPYGYRVQVVASPEYETASGQAARVNELLAGRLPVYVELVDPWYKVRVGDFVTQEAAQPTVEELRELGFADAWAVHTTIKQAE
jgi:septal ring-binding cell division protein DamX